MADAGTIFTFKWSIFAEIQNNILIPYLYNQEALIDWSKYELQEESLFYPKNKELQKIKWQEFSWKLLYNTLSLLILKVISCIPPTGTLSLPVVNNKNFFCNISL